ncbi:MAG: AraC family transcriptional regulator [Spirochaetia bacterium]|nr:AraC family transcriptional regulator [Spirochaetia bacterium]MCF7945849.1 AraC family transcriptional regulator [Spirochaetia bacterium]
MDKRVHCSYNKSMLEKHFTKYLTYSNEDEKWQIFATDAGSNIIGPYTTYPPYKEHHPKPFKSVATGRILNEFQIIYITAGHGTFISNETSYKVLPGTIMLLFPGIKHAYKPDYPVGWTEYWIGFQGNYCKKLMSEGILSNKKPIYYIGFHHNLLLLFKKVIEEAKKQEPLYQYRIGANIIMIIAEFLSYAKKEVQLNQSQEIVEKAKYYFNLHLYEFTDIDSVAEKIGISKSYLCEVFKSYTGMTPYQYFIHEKVNKAKELLEIGDLSIKEVAYNLGFEDQYYFSRLFKKKTGVPPSQWAISLYQND